MKKTGIIGGGFTGTMTAIRLIQKLSAPCEINIINQRETFAKGIAFSAYSDKHLLNVITAKMSAFPDQPDHFLDWVMLQPGYEARKRELIANAFLPRRLFGVYIAELWQNILPVAASKNITINVINNFVTALNVEENAVSLGLDNDTCILVDYCVIATGNNIPRNPRIKNPSFYDSKSYFRNPWGAGSVEGVKDEPAILIVGNGLTMVDTVLGLLEQGFKGKLYSISPNGFNILPHRHNGMKYTGLINELTESMSLPELVKLVNRHIKMIREYGVSAEPVIDSLRPYTQKIWRSFSEKEKDIFMARLRHLWGVARHRIPLHSHDKLQQLRIDGRMMVISGKLIDIAQSEGSVAVEYMDRKDGNHHTINVSRVINCTGPESDLVNVDKSFLKSCVLNGILSQDRLKLGIVTDVDTFGIIGPNGRPYKNLFTLGSNLRGELWESTAVNELRSQADKLADSLAAKIASEVPAMAQG